MASNVGLYTQRGRKINTGRPTIVLAGCCRYLQQKRVFPRQDLFYSSLLTGHHRVNKRYIALRTTFIQAVDRYQGVSVYGFMAFHKLS